MLCVKANDDEKRILQRWYWALVIGTPRRPKGVISAPLGKVSTGLLVTVILEKSLNLRPYAFK